LAVDGVEKKGKKERGRWVGGKSGLSAEKERGVECTGSGKGERGRPSQLRLGMRRVLAETGKAFLGEGGWDGGQRCNTVHNRVPTGVSSSRGEQQHGKCGGQGRGA
jgi:hypothetical protein